MSENSKIQWTDHTVNFVIGCVKVDELCTNCYADEMDDRRFSKTLPGTSKESPVRHWGLNAPRYLRIDGASNDLIRLSRKARIAGRIDKVFINSLSDTFEDRNDLEEARLALFAMVGACENLIFQLLTKRPENVNRMVPHHWLENWPRNAWMGTSVGNQKTADIRIPELLKIPAVCRFLSVEPMLGPIDFEYPETLFPNGPAMCCDGRECGCQGQPIDPPLIYGIHWIIVGGESGSKARPFHTDWASVTVAQCKAAGIACFVKQLGAKPMIRRPDGDDAATLMDFPLKLKDAKGGDMEEWKGMLADLRVREFPKQ